MATIHANFAAPQGATQLTPQQQAAAQRAFATWEATLQNDIDIYVTVLAAPLQGGLEGICIPNLVQGNRNGVDITVTTAQGNALGTQPFAVQTNQNNPDMVIFVNNASVFNYGNIPNTHTHFQTMILHEMCHGLGFLGLCNVGVDQQAENIGIFSDLTLLGLVEQMGLNNFVPFWNNMSNALVRIPALPAAPTPPALGQRTYPTLFATTFRRDVTDGVMIDYPPRTLYGVFNLENSMYIQAQIVPAPQVENCNVFTIDNQINVFTPFTSCDHINYNSNTGCLMYYTLGTNIIPAPDYRTEGILRTIGWNVAP